MKILLVFVYLGGGLCFCNEMPEFLIEGTKEMIKLRTGFTLQSLSNEQLEEELVVQEHFYSDEAKIKSIYERDYTHKFEELAFSVNPMHIDLISKEDLFTHGRNMVKLAFSPQATDDMVWDAIQYMDFNGDDQINFNEFAHFLFQFHSLPLQILKKESLRRENLAQEF